MNNEQVIKYVSENSKNPHAAMIAEWLLTGCDVEFQYPSGSWGIASTPNWSNRTKYRLVRKPAYKIALIGKLPFTARNDGEAREYEQNPEFIKWLSDWIEFDPEPKQWPTPLVERIAAIDIKAAEWIVDHWDELLNDKYNLGGNYSVESPRLRGMFFWEPTDQGDIYWRKISHRLGE